MSDWPNEAGRVGLGTWVIGPTHPLALGNGIKHLSGDGTFITSTAWPAANRAILFPFRLPKPAMVYQAVVGCGATASGNFDVGVYDTAGNRLVSSGATAKTASTEVVCNLTDTLLGQGLYYAALAANGTNNYVASTPGNVAMVKVLGVRQASTAYTLPATITFETAASAYIPGFSIWLRSN